MKEQDHTQVTRVQGASCLEKYWTITSVEEDGPPFLQMDGGAVAVCPSQQDDIATAVDSVQDDGH